MNFIISSNNFIKKLYRLYFLIPEVHLIIILLSKNIVMIRNEIDFFRNSSWELQGNRKLNIHVSRQRPVKSQRRVESSVSTAGSRNVCPLTWVYQVSTCIIILLTAWQFACWGVLEFCRLIIILLMDWLFDFIDGMLFCISKTEPRKAPTNSLLHIFVVNIKTRTVSLLNSGLLYLFITIYNCHND